MAVFLWSLVGKPNIASAHGLDDVVAGSFYEPAVRWLKGSGVTSGTTATKFSPDDPVTRAQLAAFLFRLTNDYGWTPVWTPPG